MKIAAGWPLAPLGALALFIAPLLLASGEFFRAGAVKMYLLETLYVAFVTGLALATAIRLK